MRLLGPIHAWGTAAWLGLAGGAGLGFIARDVLELAQPEVAFSWFAGAGLGLAWATRGLRRRLREYSPHHGVVSFEGEPTTPKEPP